MGFLDLMWIIGCINNNSNYNGNNNGIKSINNDNNKSEDYQAIHFFSVGKLICLKAINLLADPSNSCRNSLMRTNNVKYMMAIEKTSGNHQISH